MTSSNLTTCDMFLVSFFTFALTYLILKFLNFVKKTISNVAKEYKNVKRSLRDLCDELHNLNHTMALIYRDGNRSLGEMNSSLKQFQTGTSRFNIANIALQLLQSLILAFATPTTQSTTNTIVNKYFDDVLDAPTEPNAPCDLPIQNATETTTSSHNDGVAEVLSEIFSCIGAHPSVVPTVPERRPVDVSETNAQSDTLSNGIPSRIPFHDIFALLFSLGNLQGHPTTETKPDQQVQPTQQSWGGLDTDTDTDSECETECNACQNEVNNSHETKNTVAAD